MQSTAFGFVLSFYAAMTDLEFFVIAKRCVIHAYSVTFSHVLIFSANDCKE